MYTVRELAFAAAGQNPRDKPDVRTLRELLVLAAGYRTLKHASFNGNSKELFSLPPWHVFFYFKAQIFS